MRLTFAGVLVAVLLAASGPAFSLETAPAAQRVFTSLDLFALESANDPQLSPDGRVIVYVRRGADVMTDRYGSSLWRVNADGTDHRALVGGPGAYSRPRWSPDGTRLLYNASGEGGGEVRVLDLASGSDWSLGRFQGSAQGAEWSPDGRRIAFTQFVEAKAPSFAAPVARPNGAQWGPPARVYDRLNVHLDGMGFTRPGASQVFVVPAEGGTPRALTEGEVSYGGLVWLDDETVLVTGNAAPDADLDPRESEIYAVSLNGGPVRALTDRRGPDGSPAVSPDGRTIAFVGYDDRQVTWQTPELYVMDADGANRRSLTAGLDRPVSSPAWAPDGRSIYATVMNEGRVELVRVSLAGEVTRVAADLGAGAGGRPYVGGSFSLAPSGRGVSIAYTQGFADRPSEIAVVRPGAAPRRLTELNEDALGHVSMATVRPLPVTSPVDGRRIDAWVALPPGFEPGRSHPLILEIHGGPAIMYGPAFATEIQRFAAEGFVVVWANQRGSLGYGEEFAMLIDRNYPGQDDLADLMGVVDAAVAQGYGDARRLFVTGGSAGGAMTAWTVGNTDRFAAAVAVNPVINWTSVMLFGDTAAHVARHQIRAYPWDEPELFWRQSPLSRVGHVTTPTMLMVGDEDWRTPPAEAEQFYTALKLRGIETALVRIPGSGHNIGVRPSQHIAKTDNIIGWFRAHDPGAEGTGRE